MTIAEMRKTAAAKTPPDPVQACVNRLITLLARDLLYNAPAPHPLPQPLISREK